jgi:hypothetical protein
MFAGTKLTPRLRSTQPKNTPAAVDATQKVLYIVTGALNDS